MSMSIEQKYGKETWSHRENSLKLSEEGSHRDTSRKSIRSIMNKSIERNRSLSKSAKSIDVKCINCGQFISEEKVEEHSKV